LKEKDRKKERKKKRKEKEKRKGLTALTVGKFTTVTNSLDAGSPAFEFYKVRAVRRCGCSLVIGA